MIKVEALTKKFRLRQGVSVAVDGISFEVEEGEFFTLLGPSGCGKTTTLRCIAGLERPTSGVISIDGQAVYENRVLVPTNERGLGMVFQSYAVWPHMSVFNNVAFPLTVVRSRRPRAEIRKLVAEHLELVGLGGLESRMATQLSGGQQQRLSLARALVSSPRVLLLDEPLSNLDAKLRERMRSELREIQQRVGITTLFVTHDQVEALSMSDRVAVMRAGRFVQLGTPEEVYQRPNSAFVAHFIGGTNLLEGTVTQATGDEVVVDTAFGRLRGLNTGDVATGDRVIGSIRLEDVVLEPNAADQDGATGENRLSGEIVLRLFNGPSVQYHIDLPGGQLQARMGSRRALPPSDRVAVVLPSKFFRVMPLDKEALVESLDSEDAVDDPSALTRT
jgi:iron(III) transport system ATP-binding protein